MKSKEMLSIFTKILVVTLFPLLIFTSCKDNLTIPIDNDSVYSEGIYILCEGLWRQDNSTLSHYDITSNAIVNNVFTTYNPTLRLGDTGNDIIEYKGMCYVAVSTSKSIEVFTAGTTKSVGRILFDGKIEPRSLTILNDSVGYVTTLGDDSVIEFNPTTLERKTRFTVGPAPEGLAHWKHLVFVANSGYGDFRVKEPLAGYLTLLNTTTKSIQQSFYVGPNLLEAIVDTVSNYLYCYYAHLPSQKDSLPGLVKYSLPDLTEIHRWRLPSMRSLSFIDNNTTLLFLTDKGVSTLDLRSAESTPSLLLSNEKPSEIWTGVSMQFINSQPTILVSNSKNYSVNGALLFYSKEGVFLKEYPVGLNPTKHCYYRIQS
jgi:hypothetical protein